MTTMRVILQPAFVLHARSYRDTSLLVELFTAQQGRLSAVARGVRSARSRSYGMLKPFSPLLVSYSGKNDLQTLSQVEVDGLSYNLDGNMLLSGFYLNELLMRLLQRHDPYPSIYNVYKRTLASLADSKQPEPTLRLFEKSLLSNLGYGLQLDRTVDNKIVLPEEKYAFEYGVGLKKATELDSLVFSGKSLLALHAGILDTKEGLRDAKQLLRSVLAILLGDKPLKSRELFV